MVFFPGLAGLGLIFLWYGYKYLKKQTLNPKSTPTLDRSDTPETRYFPGSYERGKARVSFSQLLTVDPWMA